MRFIILIFLVTLGARASNLDEGLHAMTAGDWPRAEQALRQAANEAPRNFHARFNHASVLRELGSNEEAVAEYRAALPLARHDADRADALYGIALAEDAAGDPVGATQAWTDYLAFAGRLRTDRAAVAVARERLEILTGTQKAAR